MRLVKQTRFGSPEDPKEEWGNCFSTCIACLFDMEPDDVPHWLADCDGDQQQAAEACQQWLQARGWAMHAWLWPEFPDDLHRGLAGVVGVMTGKAPKPPHWPHAVLGQLDGRGGWRLVHDPGRTDAGLMGDPEAIALVYPLPQRAA